MAIGVLGGNKNARSAEGGRILVTINVLGSAGPIRFLIGEREVVSRVIAMALKAYARQGRIPLLASDPNEFLLFCSQSDYNDALDLNEPIGAKGGRNFVLCKKELYLISPLVPAVSSGADRSRASSISPEKKKSGGNWKAWLNKSFNFKISSH